MPHASVACKWGSVVQLLSDLTKQGGARANMEHQDPIISIHQQLCDLSDIMASALPRVTWKQLIRDAKVPQRLAQVCCSLQLEQLSCSSNNNSGSSSNNSGSSGIVGDLTWMAWRALKMFLDAAVRNLCDNRFVVEGEKDNCKPLTRSVTQQLQASGLLQQFPDILLTAAGLLAAEPAATSSGTTTGAAAACATCMCSMASGRVSRGPGRSGGGSRVLALGFLVGVVCKLLEAVSCISVLQPSHEEFVRSLDAAGCLANSLMRHLSTVLTGLPADLSQRPQVALECRAAASTCRAVLSSLAAYRLQLQRADAVAAVSLLGFMIYASTLLPEEPPGPEAACLYGDLAGSHAVAVASHDAAMAAAAQVAALVAGRPNEFSWMAGHSSQPLLSWRQQQQQHETADMQEGRQQQQQLQVPMEQHTAPAADPCWLATGVSIQAAAWLAFVGYEGRRGMQGPDFLEQTLADVTFDECRWFTAPDPQADPSGFCSQPQQQPGQRAKHPATPGSARQPQHASVLQCQHSLLLAQLLLHSVEQQPCGRRGSLDAADALAAATLAADTIRMTDASLQAAQLGVECIRLLGAWLEGSLPVMLRLLRRAVQLLEQGSPQDTSSPSSCNPSADCYMLTPASCGSGGHSPAAGRGSTGSSAGAGASTGTPDGTMRMTAVQCCVFLLVVLLKTAANNTCCPADEQAQPAQQTPAPGAQPALQAAAGGLRGECLTDSPGSGRAAAADSQSVTASEWQPRVWAQHSRELCSVMEGLLRVLGRGTVNQGSSELVEIISNSMLQHGQPLSAAARSAGLGQSPALSERRLCSLLCTLLKLGRGNIVACFQAAACIDSHMTGHCQLEASSQSDGNAGAAAATHGMVWLVLAGRCCLTWAAALRQLQGRADLGRQLVELAAAAAAGPDDGLTAKALCHSVAELLQVPDGHAAMAVLACEESLAWYLLGKCHTWLQQEGRAAQLAAAGYPVQAVQQQLDAALASLEKLYTATDAAAALAAYELAVTQLRQVGQALNTLAVTHACNNPACASLSGPTELDLVSSRPGRTCACGSCRTARYCSRECSVQHWKQHKPVCMALKAARRKSADQSDGAA